MLKKKVLALSGETNHTQAYGYCIINVSMTSLSFHIVSYLLASEILPRDHTNMAHVDDDCRPTHALHGHA
jgi:hypothetical protein